MKTGQTILTVQTLVARERDSDERLQSVLTVAEVCRLFGVSRSAVYAAIGARRDGRRRKSPLRYRTADDERGTLLIDYFSCVQRWGDPS